ncbi:hypothetical protein RA8CHR_05322 [Variovorax sp. RA8]|nr:hypothetical protein RA8CHR_05322 [Variovorax sp. RA8]
MKHPVWGLLKTRSPDFCLAVGVRQEPGFRPGSCLTTRTPPKQANECIHPNLPPKGKEASPHGPHLPEREPPKASAAARGAEVLR